ncbi:MAG TPA: PBP1A family penicillin-binding protein [Candidatus Saccharimonadia bacterium]
MARSTAKKHRSSRPVSFHEAIPFSLPPTSTIPHVADHLEETAAAWNETWRSLYQHVRQGNWHQVRTITHAALGRGAALVSRAVRVLPPAGRSIWQFCGTAAMAGRQSGRRLAATTQQFWNASRSAVVQYAPSIGIDLRAALRQVRRWLASKAVRRTLIALIVLGIAVASYALVSLAANTLKRYADSLSSPAAIMYQKKTGTTILDKDGNVLFAGYGAQDQGFLALKDIPKPLIDATLAAEDPQFYDHPGFSWEGTIRAAWIDLQHGSTDQGGSTLTQQLVKNTLLTQDKNFIRKFNELLLSMRVEQRYSKDQILEMYLNSIYYGQGAAGVQAASQTYFHKDAKDLSLGEAALIAGLPLGPGRFDPNYDLEAATGRRNFVLARMLSQGKITKQQADEAKAQPLALADTAGAVATDTNHPSIVYARQIKLEAPHFVFYVLNQLRQQYGEDLVEFGGITVRTTLDLTKQHVAEDAVRTRISQLTNHHVTNGGLISLEPSSGNILAMVGSVDYNAPGFGNVNVTLSDLQPGSSFKPFAYATAFKKGWNGATVVDDVPVSFPQADGTVYAPQNYDLKFHGKVTLRKALDNSLNIPAIKVLQYAGLHDTIQTAHDLGITTLQDESRFGLSLVLGGGEVRPIDMASAYATLANGGTRVEPRAITKVADRTGQDITKPSASSPTPVLDPRIAYMITNILSDDASRQPEFPANGPLHLSRPAAAKTGTTNDFRDNWTVGYTPQIATAVWVGNNDHSAMQNVDGITGAAPIWHDYMENALRDLPVQNFSMPGGVTMASICPDGSLADNFTTSITEVFMSDNLPKNHCSHFGDFNPFASPSSSPNSTPSPDNNTPQSSPPNEEDQAPVVTPSPIRFRSFDPALQ